MTIPEDLLEWSKTFDVLYSMVVASIVLFAIVLGTTFFKAGKNIRKVTVWAVVALVVVSAVAFFLYLARFLTGHSGGI